MNRVLVTGGSGFVGSAVVRQLIAQGIEVCAATAREDVLQERVSYNGPLLTAVDRHPPVDLLRELECDTCIHCGWYVNPADYLTSSENDECVRESLRLANALLDAGCNHLVATGTCFEYAFRDSPLTEDAPLGPATPYASAKKQTRESIRALLNDTSLSFTWARIFYLHGPWEAPARLVPVLATRLLSGEPAKIGDATLVRDYMHVDDVAGALVAAARTPESDPRDINISSGVGISIGEIATTIARHFDRLDLLQFGALPPRLGDPPYIVGDSSRLRATGWKPEKNPVDAVLASADWWKDYLSADRWRHVPV